MGGQPGDSGGYAGAGQATDWGTCGGAALEAGWSGLGPQSDTSGGTRAAGIRGAHHLLHARRAMRRQHRKHPNVLMWGAEGTHEEHGRTEGLAEADRNLSYRVSSALGAVLWAAHRSHPDQALGGDRGAGREGDHADGEHP